MRTRTGGVRYEPYRPLIEARLGRSVPYIDVYNATEGGIMGGQDRSDGPAMLLLPYNGIFYEFVPLDALGSTTPERLSLWEVELDRAYALALNACTAKRRARSPPHASNSSRAAASHAGCASEGKLGGQHEVPRAIEDPQLAAALVACSGTARG